jgi:hypothetical protein
MRIPVNTIIQSPKYYFLLKLYAHLLNHLSNLLSKELEHNDHILEDLRLTASEKKAHSITLSDEIQSIKEKLRQMRNDYNNLRIPFTKMELKLNKLRIISKQMEKHRVAWLSIQQANQYHTQKIEEALSLTHRSLSNPLESGSQSPSLKSNGIFALTFLGHLREIGFDYAREMESLSLPSNLLIDCSDESKESIQLHSLNNIVEYLSKLKIKLFDLRSTAIAQNNEKLEKMKQNVNKLEREIDLMDSNAKSSQKRISALANQLSKLDSVKRSLIADSSI